MHIRITTNELFQPYGLKLDSRHRVVRTGTTKNIYYVRNPLHDPTQMPPTTAAWVAVHRTECEVEIPA